MSIDPMNPLERERTPDGYGPSRPEPEQVEHGDLERAITDILVALDDWLVPMDGPEVDEARRLLTHELLLFVRENEGGE